MGEFFGWLLGWAWLYDSFGRKGPEPRKRTLQERVHDKLESAAMYNKWKNDHQAERVRPPAREAYERCEKEYNACKALVESASPDWKALEPRLDGLLKKFGEAMSMADRDRQAYLDSGADLGMAEMAIESLNRLSPEAAAPLSAELTTATATREGRQYEQAAQMANRLRERARVLSYGCLWKKALSELAFWRYGDADNVAPLAEYSEFPKDVATWHSDQVAEKCRALSFDLTRTWLAFTTVELAMDALPRLAKWQHFVRPFPTPFERMAELSGLRAAFSEQAFGQNSAEHVSALMAVSSALVRQGMFCCVPGIYATRDERKTAQERELGLYARSWSAVAEAVECADAAWGKDSVQAKRAIARAALTTRPRDTAMSEELRERLERFKAELYKPKATVVPAPAEPPASD